MLASCGVSEDYKILPVNDSLFCKAVSGQNIMGFDLLREISKQEQNKNILISPSGLFLCLSMTANGAADSTLESMLGFMKLNGFGPKELNRTGRSMMHYLRTKDSVELSIANLICLTEDTEIQYKKRFISAIARYYDTEPKTARFSDPESLDMINRWVAEKTNNKIKEVLSAIEGNVLFLVMNALYFKGTWQSEFDPDNTTDRPFKLNDSAQVMVPMMEQKGEYELFRDRDLGALRLPYFGGFSMIIILPNKTDGLASVVSQWNEERWKHTRSNMSHQVCKIMIPRFKYEYSRHMRNDFLNWGMRLPFDEQQANFSHMADFPLNRNLFLRQIIQKTFIEVDEKGSEAAAVTFALGSGRGPASDELFRADHPFLFMIVHDQTGIVVFSGMVRHFDGKTHKPAEFPENLADLTIDFHAGKIIGLIGSGMGGSIGLYPLIVKELDSKDPFIDSLRKTVDNKMEKLLVCYKRVMKENPEAKGILKVQVIIDSGGRVIKTSVKRNMFNSEFELCTVNTIRKWVFPEYKKGPLTVDLQFVFNNN